ncbi:unnamed protein product [Darwinula stevensoni]|uniref:Aconitase/3-isopropylmalate dehydratase large subunit alpha/beta/alpha domain-containing protein n=1 Tax=Darwinula stevensoni TaxID=69355 RepID=A0A7R9FPU7_9CRUS|nr:unnamed protein product [Darwinula stevensoni]CAG0898497.1 unnamed protein product [Darwinula stevensoni]
MQQKEGIDIMGVEKANPFLSLLSSLTVDGKTYSFYDLSKLNDPRYERLPFSIRVLLESAIRNCDDFQVTKADVDKILDWEVNQDDPKGVDIPFRPARTLLQDFTGVPAVVDFAAMRDAVKRLGGDPECINPVCQADLVIDHSIQVDFARTPDALQKNEEMEFERNKERFRFLKLLAKKTRWLGTTVSSNDITLGQAAGSGTLQTMGVLSSSALTWHHGMLEASAELWGAKALKNMLIVPPGSGIVHQVNLEYLARVVFQSDDASSPLLFPDSLVGTDSHTTMINGLGVFGWGVGVESDISGIEAEAVMLGQCISMVLPPVVGYRIVGHLNPLATATDVVLTITKHLREVGVVGKLVEFFGPGVASLSIADRATISNMCPEYGATLAFFPVDINTMQYLTLTGRKEAIGRIEAYLKTVKMYRQYEDAAQDPVFSKVVELDLGTVVPSVSGPKRPQDRISVDELKQEFLSNLTNKVSRRIENRPQVTDESHPVMVNNVHTTMI